MCVIYHNPQPEWSSHLGDINSKWLRRAKIRNGLRSIVRKLLMVFEPQFLIWATYVGFQDIYGECQLLHNGMNAFEIQIKIFHM